MKQEVHLFSIPCDHSGKNYSRRKGTANHHPLTEAQLRELVSIWEYNNAMGQHMDIIMRIEQGIPGMTCPPRPEIKGVCDQVVDILFGSSPAIEKTQKIWKIYEDLRKKEVWSI